MKECEFPDCGLVAKLYQTVGPKKSWLCVEHYDSMALLYKKQAKDPKQVFAREMVKFNGW